MSGMQQPDGPPLHIIALSTQTMQELFDHITFGGAHRAGARLVQNAIAEAGEISKRLAEAKDKDAEDNFQRGAEAERRRVAVQAMAEVPSEVDDAIDIHKLLGPRNGHADA